MTASFDDLAGISLFRSLEDSDLRRLATWFDVQYASEGVRLAGEGAAGYSFFVLADGTADVSSGDDTIATLGPGDFFGEIAILGNGRRTASVTTTSPARLLVLFGSEFRRLEAEHPEIAAHIEAAMRRRVAAS